MQLTDIPRIKPGAEIVPVTDTEIGMLAQAAAEKLGYKVLRAAHGGSQTLGVTTGALTEALLRLEIEVLDSDAVVRYQTEELARQQLAEIRRKFRDYTIGYFYPGSWQHSSLKDYKEPIPEFVIRKALQIKEGVPEVQFFIQHLHDPKGDPFLIAALGEEIYYVEVWAEPRFEGSL